MVFPVKPMSIFRRPNSAKDLFQVTIMLAASSTYGENQFDEKYRRPKPLRELTAKLLGAWNNDKIWDPMLQCLDDGLSQRGRNHTEKDEQMNLLIKQTKHWVMGTSLWLTNDSFRNEANRISLSHQLWSQEHGKAAQQFHRTSGEMDDPKDDGAPS